ncbi:MAG TPA: ATP-binding protein [Thermoanaerobaculia bacterium]|nr:ATP-binding protein [Thermoanaerobaculia bacterium]
MHPLRVTLLISFAIALAISVAFGYVLHRLAIPEAEVLVIAAAVFAAFLIPWTAVFLWALRRASDLDELSDRTRAVAHGNYDRVIADRPFHGELDDLARTTEELRAIVLRQKASYEEQGATLQKIVGAIGEGLMALNDEGRVVFTNARVGEMFGYDDTMSGRSYLEIVRKQPLVDAFQAALKGEERTTHVSVTSPRGKRQIEIRVFPVASSDIAAVALFIDMTEIVHAQQMKKEFLDDFSHEVRTPLAGLQSAAESFDGHLTPEQEKELRAIMFRQLSRIERLVNDLAELNRIESGTLVLERRDTDLLALARETSDEFRSRVAGRQVVFEVQGARTFANADPARVQQILINLLDNAAKHGGEKGEVLVEIGAEGSEAVLRVSDRGEGIPPDDVERIFERFYRVDRSRSVPGAGLGLAIARHLAVLHGGSIRAFNRAGGGATFEVRLPLSVAVPVV